MNVFADTFLNSFSFKICLGFVSSLSKRRLLYRLHIWDAATWMFNYWSSILPLFSSISNYLNFDKCMNAFKKVALFGYFATSAAVLVWWTQIWFTPDLRIGGLKRKVSSLWSQWSNDRMDEIKRNANGYVMPHPINIKFKFRHDVRCLLLDSMSDLLDSLSKNYRSRDDRNQSFNREIE